MTAGKCKRRVFLKQAAKVSSAIVAGSFLTDSMPTSGIEHDMILNRGNPVLKPGSLLYCNKDGSVELRSGKKQYNRVSDYYPGLDVDIILLIAANKPLGSSLHSLCERYSTNHNEICRRARKMLQELKSKDLIYFSIS